MALPVNIEQLINGTSVESERLEFKKSWNPEDVIHSMCAFANDLHNWGGGYIIIGIEEKNGTPVLPPYGMLQDQIDTNQKKLLELGHKIQPNYFPILQPYFLQNQHILVLWCPAGDNRVYTAPVTLRNGSAREPYVRVGSNSVIARGETLRRLQELTARIPFDDRINYHGTLADLDLSLIQAYLQEVKSELFTESQRMPFDDLCRTMLIAKGANEDIKPVNVGLLFFCRNPERFFDRSWIELVWHKDNTGSNFKEYFFKGPLHKQLRDVLSFLQVNIIAEYVIKHPGIAEAERYFNFPFAAIEEVLSNAVYHKSYELVNPIEVQVWQDKIEVLSYPGPVPPVDAKVLKTYRRIVAREYRNRRIGDFLKELHLTEGRGTGLPTIYRTMSDNGSPMPIFDTDEECTYVLVTLPAHKGVANQVNIHAKELAFSSLNDIINYINGVTNGVTNGATNGATNVHGDVGKPVIDILNNELHERVAEMLEILTVKMKRSDLFEKMDLSNQTFNRAKYLDPLISLGWVNLEFPGEKTHPNQTYQLSEAGKRILELIKAH